MHKAIEVKETNWVIDGDAVCVLYANVSYAEQDGTVIESKVPISGIFQACVLEMPPRKDKDGFQYVYVWCNVNDITFENTDDDQEESCWVVLKVPPNGLIELPNYNGELISHIKIA